MSAEVILHQEEYENLLNWSICFGRKAFAREMVQRVEDATQQIVIPQEGAGYEEVLDTCAQLTSMLATITTTLKQELLTAPPVSA